MNFVYVSLPVFKKMQIQVKISYSTNVSEVDNIVITLYLNNSRLISIF